MKKIILVGLILLSCLISGVTAETSEETYTSSGYYVTKMTDFVYGSSWVSSSGNSIVLRALDYADNYNGLSFLSYEGNRIRISHNSAYTQYINSIPVTIDGYSAILSAEEHYNLLGNYVSTDIWINFENPSLIKSLPSAPGYITVSLPSGYATNLPGPGREWQGLPSYSLEGSSNHRILWSTQAGNTAQSTRLQAATTPYWENTLSAEYGLDSRLGYITLTRNGYESNLSVYDLSNNLIYNNYEPDDISKRFLGYEYKYRLENAFGNIWEKTLLAGTELDLSITKSKDKVLTLNEEETYYLKGLTSLDDIKTIIWTTQKLKDDESRDENYYPTGERYQRINSTHFEKLTMANGAVLSEDILPVSTDFLEISESFREDGQYKTSCDIFETSASGLGILIGSPYVLTEVSDIGELVKMKVITINSETAGTISNCDLNVYKLNSTGETLIHDVFMRSSSANVNLEFGELYKFEASKKGYVDAEVIKQITTPDIIILYLKPASGDGFTTASFTVRDTDKNRLADVKIEMDGKTKYTNTGGIATFTELNQNSTYTYTITHPEYIEETGTIETELEDLVNIDVVLYKESEVYPTPTETEGPSWITEKPNNMKDSFLLSFYMITGIEDLETLKLLSGVLLSALIGIIAASITKDGTGFLAGGIIGFIGAIGLGWIPIWLLIALIVITGCYFIFSRGDS